MNRFLLTGMWTMTALASGCIGPPRATTDPEMVAAANAAGTPILALEVAMLGAGLVTGISPGALPADAVNVGTQIANQLFGSCATVRAISGATTGFRIEFATGGCGIPDTPVRAEGTLALETTEQGATTSWTLTLTRFSVASLLVLDGAIRLNFSGSNTLSYTITNLTATTAGTTLALNAQGTLTSERAHTIATFSGTGTVTLNGVSRSLNVQSLQRHLSTDCYPESGTVTLDVGTTTGTTTASFQFLDDNFGIDSDDTGLAWLTLNGRRAAVQLPNRSCVGF